MCVCSHEFSDVHSRELGNRETSKYFNDYVTVDGITIVSSYTHDAPASCSHTRVCVNFTRPIETLARNVLVPVFEREARV